MNNRTTVAIQLSTWALFVTFLAAGCATQTTADLREDSPEERAHLERQLRDILDASAQKDLDRLDSYHLYGPKFTKFAASSPDRLDANAARKGEHDGLASIENLKLQAEFLKIDLFGDVAITTCILDATFTVGDKPIHVKDRTTLIFVKEDGTWKIAHEHISPIQ